MLVSSLVCWRHLLKPKETENLAIMYSSRGGFGKTPPKADAIERGEGNVRMVLIFYFTLLKTRPRKENAHSLKCCVSVVFGRPSR